MEFGDGFEVEAVLLNDDMSLDASDLLTPKSEAMIIVDCVQRETEIEDGEIQRELRERERERLDRRKKHKRFIQDPWIRNINGQDSNPYTCVLTNRK